VESLPAAALSVESLPAVPAPSVRPGTKIAPIASPAPSGASPEVTIDLRDSDAVDATVLAPWPDAGVVELRAPPPLRGHYHFVDRDPAVALAVWDRYLAAKPEGDFSVEAKYNRILCLIRLDRLGAARMALTPFAEGHFGTFWQEEAARLLSTLHDP
jgi:hypothetical protein